MRKKILVAGIIVSIVGLGTASLSLSEFLHIQNSGLETPSVCAISETINCDIVNASSYASLLGLPTAAWGILFYIAVLGFLFFIRLSKAPKKSAMSFVWALSIFGLIFSLRMAYVSVFVLHAVCITCGAQYIINLVLAVILTFATTLSFKDRIGLLFSKKMFGPVLSAAIIFGIGYLFVGSALKAGPEQQLSKGDIKDAVHAFYRQSLYGIKPEDIEGAPYWGNKDAKVVIIEFSDFQCPFCRVAAFGIKPFLYEFKDKVKFVFINYPLDNACNKYMQHPMHPASCVAAEAVICGGDEGKFWELHDAIFRSQKNLNYEAVLNIAEKQGMDKAALSQCMSSEVTKKKLEKDVDLAHRIYLTGTPSILVNNRILRYWRSPEVLRAIIKEEIKKSY